MSETVLKLIPREEQDKQKVIAEAERFLERCRSGDTEGFLLFEACQTEYKMTRTNMGYNEAFMACTRMQHNLNRDWDKLSR